MKRIISGGFAAVLTLAASVYGQNGAPVLAPGQGAGAPPAYAFDITKSDIDLLLKDHPGGDKQIRVVDMGKYNMGVGVIYRGPTNEKPGDPIHVLYHDYTAETYIITSGSGILTTGGVIENKKAGTGVPNVMNGPGRKRDSRPRRLQPQSAAGRYDHHPYRGGPRLEPNHRSRDLS